MDGGSGIVIGAIVVALGAAAIIAIVHLAGVGRIGRSRWLGLRLAPTLASDETWSAAHRAATPIVWLTGSIAVIAALAALAFAGSGAVREGTVLVVLALVVLVIGLVLAGWRAVATVR
ncbi:SdpI family protein [Agrococcus baldri]|uniref:SdpI/YhfL protein family protein n=1 Tax=Agrococcus baldri TaxID=153730 RepID=A0AA87RIN1_9MICO|nr:SdpI family protein [Agrococcus baldri]GEK80981.1 hypothetical protein ABA31_23320 [Agrococcus baldri]